MLEAAEAVVVGVILPPVMRLIWSELIISVLWITCG